MSQKQKEEYYKPQPERTQVAAPLKHVHVDPSYYILLDKEWNQSSRTNANAFLFAAYINQHPLFVEPIVHKSTANKLDYTSQYSFLTRLVNKTMSKNGNSSGKKIKVTKLVVNVLEKVAAKYKLSITQLLLTTLVRTVPNYDIRRLKFGGGFLTKSVQLTVGKKISWALKQWASLFKKRKRSFQSVFTEQLSLIMDNNPKSKLLTTKKQMENIASRANLS